MQKLGLGLVLGFGMVFSGTPAWALPGQTIAEAIAWIQGNATLRPSSGERLMVRKTDTAARRYTFQASVFQVGQASSRTSSSRIRTETFTLFDMTNGVTQPRLEESLRAIYGLDIAQDYSRARVVYAYPTQVELSQARNQQTPLLAALQGELRVGDRYAYWWEIARTREGYAYSGQINVFLKQDVDKLEAELRNR